MNDNRRDVRDYMSPCPAYPTDHISQLDHAALGRLVAGSATGVLVVDSDSLEYLFANDVAARLHGIASVDELVADAATLRSADDTARLRTWLDEVLAGDHSFPEPIERAVFAAIAGPERIEITASSTAWAGHRAILIEMREISTQRDPTPKAGDDEQRARRILDASPDAMLVVDIDGRIEQINAQAVTLFGFEAQDVVGRPVETLVPFELQPMHRQQRTSYVDTDVPGHVSTGPNVVAVRKDGTTVSVEVNLSVVTLSTGLTVLATIRDVSKSRRRQRELARARDFFRGVVNGASEQSLIATDTAGRITVFSEGASRMTGYSESQMLGMAPLMLHDQDELAARAHELGVPVGFEVLSRRPSSGKPETREWTYVTADGERLTVLLSVTATFDDAGRLVGYIEVANDITRRKKVEAQLRDSEQRFRLAFDGAPIGMFLTDLREARAGQILKVNRAMCELTGHTEWDLLAANFIDMFRADDRDDLRAVLSDLVNGEVSHWDGETRGVHADGHDIWVHVAVSVASDADGRPSYSISQLEDITARKRNQAYLEERFRELSNNVRVGFTLSQVDPPETLYANPAYFTLFGFDPGGPAPSLTDAISRVTPKDHARAAAALDLLNNHQHVADEVRVMRPDGTIRWVHFALTPVADHDGTYPRVAGIYEDVTERRQADEAVRESGERFNQLAKSTAVGIFLRDPSQMIYTYVSHGFLRAFGLDATLTNIPVSAVLALVHPEDREQAKAVITLADHGQSAKVDLRIVRPDGEQRWIGVTNSPLIDDGTEPRRVAGTVEDITERKAAETALQAARSEAERANAAKDELLSRMSHELRTPLNTVLGFAQLLERDALSPSQTEAVGHILRGGEHLLAMIDQVLDINSIDADRLDTAIEPVHVARLLNDTVSAMQTLATESDIEIRFDGTQPDADRYILADLPRLRQAVLNLLSNAIKYNHPGGRVDVTVGAVDDTGLSIQIIDDGIGIPAEYLPRLYQPFDRLGRHTSDIEGTGVGLALSKRLISLMGGRLDAQSTPGFGSRFTVTMPLCDTASTPDDAQQPSDDPAIGIGSSVLYIEDSTSNVDLLTGLLRQRPDWAMTHAGTGALGLHLAAASTPTVILLDLHLPDIDGIDVLRALRARSSTANTPVAVLSADASPIQIARLLDAGAQLYLTKPLDVREVLTFLESHASSRPCGRGGLRDERAVPIDELLDIDG